MNRWSIATPNLPRLNIGEYIVPILGLGVLILTSWYSFLLFQTLAEFFSVIVCFSLLMLVWNSRRWMNNNYLFVLGIGWACSGAFDLVRIIALLDANIFVGYYADLPTQLWIASRYLQSITLLIAPLPTSFIASYGIFRTRRMWEIGVASLFALSSIFLFVTIFLRWFPEFIVEGIGFTFFKISSEFAIILILFVSLGLLWRNWEYFEVSLLWMLITAIGTAIIAEFMLAVGTAYAWGTLIGYGFRTISYYLIYLAIVQTGLKRPYDLVLLNLEQQEQRYRQMFTEHSAIQLLINLESGAIVQANPAAARFYGYSVENLQKMNWAQINMLPTEQNVAWMQEAGHRTSDHFIFQQRLASGELRDVEVHATPIQVSGRELLYSIIHDITERKQAEQALEKHQYHLEELVKERTVKLETLLREFQHSQEQLTRSTRHLTAIGQMGQAVVASLDLNTVLNQVVDSLASLLEGTEGISILLASGQEFVYAAVGGKVAAILQGQRIPIHGGVAGQVLKTGKSTRISGIDSEEIVYRDIEKITNRHVQSLLVVPLTVGEKHIGVMEVAHTARDAFNQSDLELLESASLWAAIAITNARYYEETRQRLKESQAMAEISHALSQTLDLDHILELIAKLAQVVIPQAGTAVIHLLDKKDSLLHPVAVAGTSLASQSVLGMHAGEGIASAVMEKRMVINTGDVQRYPQYISLHEASQIKSLLAAPIATDEECLGTISVQSSMPNGFTSDHERLLANLGTDAAIAIKNAQLYKELKMSLREREQTQEQLIRVEKMAALGRLVASLAHEINNPLQALRSGFGLLLKPSMSDDKRQQYLEVASKEIERLIAIVERVLGFYRPSRGYGQAEAKATNINALIDETLILAGKQLEHARVLVHRQLYDTLPLVTIYEDQLKQVFLNLILNALQAMSNGGELKVSTELASNGSEVAITFSDTGTGITEQDLPQLFEPFFTTRTNGTGLGLAITYTLVDRHGGRILVKSEVNRGSSFTVILPIQGIVREARLFGTQEKNGERS